jgi:hypothetical protein
MQCARACGTVVEPQDHDRRPRFPHAQTITMAAAGLVGDVDRDGDPEFIQADWGQDATLIFLNDGTGYFSLAPPGSGAALPDSPGIDSCVKAADFDGDGDPDLFADSRAWDFG